MKLLVDMNLSPSWVPFLEGHGFEAIHWSKCGVGSASDSEILHYAAANSFVILTHDLDFGMLLATEQLRGPSVVQIRWHNVLPLAIGETAVRAIRAAGSLLHSGALVTIDPARQRIRVLPIG